MKLASQLLFIFILVIPGALATMHLYSGIDSYGQGLSYPGYLDPFFSSSFIVQGNASRSTPIFSDASFFHPFWWKIESLNGSSYYYPMLYMQNPYSFNLQPASTKGAQNNSSYAKVSDAKKAIQIDWRHSAPLFETSATNNFMEHDDPMERMEPHSEPGRIGIDQFLDDDELPGSPLL